MNKNEKDVKEGLMILGQDYQNLLFMGEVTDDYKSRNECGDYIFIINGKGIDIAKAIGNAIVQDPSLEHILMEALSMYKIHKILKSLD